MIENKQSIHGKTLLFAMDSCDHGLLLLPHAIKLAEQMNAALQILLIEDQPLLKLAGLPFTQELSLYSRQRGTLDTLTLKNAFIRQCTELRQQVDRYTANSNLRWSLQTLEGRRIDAVLSHLESVDLIVVAGTAVTSAPVRRSHLTAQHNGGIYVSVSGDAANVRHAITLARELQNDISRLQLVAAPGSTQQTAVETDLYLVHDDSMASLFQFLRAQHAELLILPMSHPALKPPSALLQVLEKTPVPLILVR